MSTTHQEAAPTAIPLREVQNPVSGRNQEALVYAVSHDVRSSARALTELPSWLVEDIEEAGIDLPPAISDSFDLLLRHANRLDMMLRDLLVYSRAGRLHKAQRVDLSGACATALDRMSLPDWLEVDVSDLSGVALVAKSDAIDLFHALIENAVLHGDPTGTLLKISTEQSDKTLTLTFADDGPGVRDKDLDAIFLPMKTLRRRDEVECSGMGLTTVHKIVSVNGGRVFAGGAETGHGLVIRLVFPAV